jgi:predicted AlkP superfamily pyrophosphatase or phosphodiesterase
LDLSLEYLFNQLDEKIGKGEYLVFLTADHGAAIVPQELIDHKVNIEYFDGSGFRAFVKEEIRKEYGNEKIVENISNKQVFFSEKVLRKMGLYKEDVENYLSDKIMDFPGIFLSTTASAMREGTSSGHRLLLQNGYNQKRSGNVLYTINPGWISYSKTGTTHGSPFNYDTQVPFILYGWGIEHGNTTRRTLIEDIAPTITSLLHVNAPMGSTGNPVWELNESGSNGK